jgi:hypothetical protein
VFNGTTWSAFDNQAATATSAPGCGSDDGGRAVCAMRDTAGKVIVNRYNGSGWDGFINTAGLASGEPVCGNFGISGEVVCFARGSDLALWGNRFTGGTWTLAHWTGWGTLGGLVNSKGACAVTITGQLVCGAISLSDSALYVTHYNGTTWGGFQKLGQTAIGSPNCTSLGNGTVLCTIVGVNNKVSGVVGP